MGNTAELASGASTESRRRERGGHGKSTPRHGGSHRRLKRHRARNRSGFCPARANVVLAARRRRLLEQAARDCEALGGRALAVPTDITDPAQVRDLASAAASTFGRIDV